MKRQASPDEEQKPKTAGDLKAKKKASTRKKVVKLGDDGGDTAAGGGETPAGGYSNEFKLEILEKYLDLGRSGMTGDVWETLGKKHGKTGIQVKDVWRKSLYPRLQKAVQKGNV